MHRTTVETSRGWRRRDGARGPRARMLAALAVAAGLTFAGCSDEEPDPARARRERIETRLRASFSAAQADCILRNLDERTLAALDRERDLEADSPQLARYSAAAAACVADPEATVTTTTVAASTTTAPDATSTTAGDGG